MLAHMTVATPQKRAAKRAGKSATAKASTLKFIREDFFSPNPKASRVDREAGIIYGVKVLGPQSRWGRTYPADVLAQAVSLYEGAPVNIDHVDDPEENQKSVKGFGRLINVRFEAGCIFADLEYLKSHPDAAWITEAAERMPERFGLSPHHAFEHKIEDGKMVVKRIVKVASVDIVQNPATTNGFFEGTMQDTAVLDPAAEPMVAEAPTVQGVYDMVLALKASMDPAMVKEEVIAAVDEIAAKLKELGAAASAEEEEPTEEEKKKKEEEMAAGKAESAAAGLELETLRRENRAIKACYEANVKLPAAVMEAFVALDEAKQKPFLEEFKVARQTPVSQVKPRSSARTAPVNNDLPTDPAALKLAVLG